MAIIQLTYSFDVTHWHEIINSIMLQKNQLNRGTLYQMAQDAVRVLETQDATLLQHLRYDANWLDTTDTEVSRDSQWYILAFARNLVLMPTRLVIRNPGYGRLRGILTLLNWNSQDIAALIDGYPLATLIEQSENPLFIREFTFGISQYGSWLDYHQVCFFRQKLAADAVEIQARFVQRASEEPWWQQSMNAYETLIASLNTAYERGHALYFLID